MAKNYRLFAAVYDPLLRRAERTFYPQYRQRAAGGARGRVLEIGAGSGANLPYYSPDAALTVVDANIHMLRRLRAKAAAAGLDIAVHHLDAEALPFEDESFDTVVATLMLCSVDDPARTLAEAHRVLVPGGEIRFVEHVKAPDWGWAFFQNATALMWKHLAAGCHPNRDTLQAVVDAGFELEDADHFLFGPYPVRPHVVGAARKPSG